MVDAVQVELPEGYLWVSQPVRMHGVRGVSIHSPFTSHKYGLFLDRLEENIIFKEIIYHFTSTMAGINHHGGFDLVTQNPKRF